MGLWKTWGAAKTRMPHFVKVKIFSLLATSRPTSRKEREKLIG
jgi:hypothetical protein